jgi:hypothetical protein
MFVPPMGVAMLLSSNFSRSPSACSRRSRNRSLLGDVELSVGEITRSVVGIVSAKMVDVGMGHQHGIDILWVNPRLFYCSKAF